MKQFLFTIILSVSLLSFLTSYANSQINKANANLLLIKECTGEFKINGVSYTITLHDVDLWTCAKFKVASWFN